MDVTNLVISLLAGVVGMGFVMYAKNAQKLVPAVAGIGLMVIPYFLSNVILLSVVCLGLTSLPFVYRDE